MGSDKIFIVLMDTLKIEENAGFFIFSTIISICSQCHTFFGFSNGQ